MDTSFLSLFDLLILCYGFFLLAWWARAKFRGEVFPPKYLLPQDLTLEECKDLEGYKRFMPLRVLLFALLLLMMGGVSYLLGPERIGLLPALLVYAGFFALVVLLYMDTGRRARRFW